MREEVRTSAWLAASRERRGMQRILWEQRALRLAGTRERSRTERAPWTPRHSQWNPMAQLAQQQGKTQMAARKKRVGASAAAAWRAAPRARPRRWPAEAKRAAALQRAAAALAVAVAAAAVPLLRRCHSCSRGVRPRWPASSRPPRSQEWVQSTRPNQHPRSGGARSICRWTLVVARARSSAGASWGWRRDAQQAGLRQRAAAALHSVSLRRLAPCAAMVCPPHVLPSSWLLR